MPSLHFLRPPLLSAALIATAGLALSACGGNSGTTTPTTSAPAPTTSAPAPASSSAAPTSSGDPTTGSAAIAAIKANWVAFFNPKTPVSRRLELLQNGQVFEKVIKSQASSPLSLSASAKVVKVTLTGTSQAAVTYDILVGGSPALANQAGVAVYQDGIWKVGDASFCALLKLQNGGSSSGLPSACPS